MRAFAYELVSHAPFPVSRRLASYHVHIQICIILPSKDRCATLKGTLKGFV